MARGENRVDLVEPAVSHGVLDRPATKTDFDVSGDDIRAWFSSLTWEERASVLCIEDGAFLATCIDIAASPVEHHHGEGTTAGGKQDNTQIPEKKTVSLQILADAYRSYRKQMTPPLGSIVASDDFIRGVSGKGDAIQKLTDDRATASDEFRIQNGGSTEKQIEEGNSSAVLEHDMLQHFRVVFPGVLDVLSERFETEYDKPGIGRFAGRFPVISFSPALSETGSRGELLTILDEHAGGVGAFLSGQHCNAIAQSSTEWVEALKLISQTDDRVPLGLVCSVRLEVAVFEAYLVMHDRETVLAPSRPEIRSDAFDSVSQRKTVVLQANRVGSAFKEYATTGKDASSLNILLKQARQVFQLQDICEVLPRDLVFVPMTWLVHPEQNQNQVTLAAISSCDDGLTKALRANSADGFISREPEADPESERNHVDPDDQNDRGLTSPPVKKNKRKKKKKKRQMSNAGIALDAVAPYVVADSSSGSIDNKGLGSGTKTDSVVVEVASSSPSPESHLHSRPAQGKAAAGTVALETISLESRNAPFLDILDDHERTDREVPAEAKRIAETVEVTSGEKTGRKSVPEDEDAWETVESRNRTTRLKKQTAANGPAGNNSADVPVHSPSSPATSTRKGRVRTTNRRRNGNKRMARDILSGILDRVDSEIKLIRQKETMAMLEEQKRRHEEIVSKALPGSPYTRASTMRDVVLGRRKEKADAVTPLPSKRPVPPFASSPARAATRNVSGVGVSGAPTGAISRLLTEKRTKHPRVSAMGASPADQSTAPTVPETLSGMSSNTQSSSINTDGGAVVANTVDAESSSHREAVTIHRIRAYKEENKDICSPPPPLQTLLGPGNTNSASSSVASSLEAPHTSHHHHASAPNENDVGYHLLGVCDRLSRDMDVFMQRRGSALTVRRRERGALLAALQDTTLKLWPGNCHVEMYGSCATQLDLPSSDVDAVICGLVGSHDVQPMQQNSSRTQERDNNVTPVAVRHTFDFTQVSPFMSPYSPAAPLAPNAERVIRLSAELERQPWAVQVKAIPTASVPVVKILADPSRLPGAVSPAASGGDWLMQQHMAAQAAAAAAVVGPPPPPLTDSNPTPIPLYHSCQPTHYPGNTPPWRGSDVMNGLFSVDITFEGPEHGGIGSTAFSARVVQDACNETGLPHDRTPVVQVLMVLKELLAQRRLNEPFSGGMSSYGLLLLLVAVLKERKVIREELERIERQRLVVAAESCSSTAIGVSDDSTTVRSNVKQKPSVAASVVSAQSSVGKSTNDTRVAPRIPSAQSPQRAVQFTNGQLAIPTPAISSASSWASIARKNSDVSASSRPTVGNRNSQRHANSDAGRMVGESNSPKPTTFADIVNNSRPKDVSARLMSKATTNIVEETDPIAARLTSQAPRTAQTEQEGEGASTCMSEMTKLLSTKDATASTDVEPGFGEASLFPQGTNDVLEVLCSGEMTAGKLLMHFLLFYGQHFDSRTSAVDVSGTHKPDHCRAESRQAPFHLTPFVPRKPGGTIDPVTGMLTVDPIVVYDPLEGAENNNVARSCFAWNSIRWVFAQSYMTLASVVERSETPSTTPTVVHNNTHHSVKKPTATTATSTTVRDAAVRVNAVGSSKQNGTATPDMVSPLLEMLLSF